MKNTSKELQNIANQLDKAELAAGLVVIFTPSERYDVPELYLIQIHQKLHNWLYRLMQWLKVAKYMY